MRIVDFKIPTSVKETCSMLKELGSSAVIFSGGTSPVFIPGIEPRIAIDITRLGLDGIQREDGTFRIGATTTIAALRKHRDKGWVLDKVARRFVTQQLRNRVTLGGNIMRIFPWSDFPAALLALDAEMIMGSESNRSVGAGEFFSSQPFRLLKPGEILKAVRVEALGSSDGFGYRKETRTASGFSLATAAVKVGLEGNRIKSARVAVGAGIPFPSRLNNIENDLIGKPADEKTFRLYVSKGMHELKFKGTAGMSDDYCAQLASVAICDALLEASAQARGETK